MFIIIFRFIKFFRDYEEYPLALNQQNNET